MTTFIFIFYFLSSSVDIDDRVNISVIEEEYVLEDTPMPLEDEKEIINVDFQPVIDEWTKSIRGNVSVLIYDLDRDEVSGSHNIEKNYNTASLYKLFVVYEGYRRLESGEWKADDLAGATGHSVLECLDLAIRESHSPCAETLWKIIGRNNLDKIIEKDFGIKNSDISSLVSNVEDILKMMKIFYEHPDIKDGTLISRMKDSFLNQPTTEYNWRQGLPSGFSDKVNVYNKVGWDFNPDENYWELYHDSAIVEFKEENRSFIIVVMTSRVPYQQIRKFGTMIEEKFYQ